MQVSSKIVQMVKACFLVITVIDTVKTTPSFCMITTISRYREKMPEMMWLLQSLESGVKYDFNDYYVQPDGIKLSFFVMTATT